MNRFFRAVMAGLVPAIHVFSSRGNEDVDARDRPGHDEFVGTPIASNGHMRLPTRKREREHSSDAVLGNAEVTFRSFRIARSPSRLQHQGMEMLMLVLQ
ncbi:hypothetical protein [Bradyrhizobium sp. BRP56]|uniref:hypothetical protein n=1 Tax=Bradyrhizobium sp. BRP56 TaxID=2793819 RepID=UPI001CD2220D|nr:hypothetical protein [Bradyrhizobium sp. BRP56]MCA1402850.1 hypothetical protein [Bradyrhizobium sp. BRP56]